MRNCRDTLRPAPEGGFARTATQTARAKGELGKRFVKYTNKLSERFQGERDDIGVDIWPSLMAIILKTRDMERAFQSKIYTQQN